MVFPSLQSPLSGPEGPEIRTASNPGWLNMLARSMLELTVEEIAAEIAR